MGVGAYQISGGASGGVLIIAVAMLMIVASVVATAIFSASLVGLFIAGGLSLFSMRAYVGNINSLLDLNEQGKVSDDELNGSIVALSLFAIISSILGIKGKINGDNLAVFDQMYIIVWNLFFSIAAIRANQ